MFKLSIHIFMSITKSYLVILKGTLGNSTIQRNILIKTWHCLNGKLILNQ